MAINKQKFLRDIGVRTVIAVLPVAMASAYASGIFASPPRQSRIDYAQVAEIVDSSSTVGIADSDLYGMTAAEIDSQLDALLAIGVTNIRVLVPWALIEYQDGTYNWSLMDTVMSAAAARNMGVMADITSTPLWAGSSSTIAGAGTPPPADYADFLQKVIDKYGSTISAYEIWNEPNYIASFDPIDPDDYTALLKAAYPVIKNATTGDPTATVVAGALGAGSTTSATMNPVDFVEAMMADGAGDYFDALSFHPYQESLKFSDGYTYPGLGTPLEQLDEIKTLIGSAKTVWISEYGLPTSNVSQQQQSDYIEDLLDYWQTYSQAGPVFIYTAQDRDSDSTNPEDTYGIFTSDGTDKLAAVMLQAWIAAHPGTTVTTPSEPPTGTSTDQVSALLASLANQITHAINQFASLGQSIITAITPFATNIVSNLVSAISAVFSSPVATSSAATARVATTAEVGSVSTTGEVEPNVQDATVVPSGSTNYPAKESLSKPKAHSVMVSTGASSVPEASASTTAVAAPVAATSTVMPSSAATPEAPETPAARADSLEPASPEPERSVSSARPKPTADAVDTATSTSRVDRSSVHEHESSATDAAGSRGVQKHGERRLPNGSAASGPSADAAPSAGRTSVTSPSASSDE